MTPDEITKARERIAESVKICEAAEGAIGMPDSVNADNRLVIHQRVFFPRLLADYSAALAEIERLQKIIKVWQDRDMEYKASLLPLG